MEIAFFIDDITCGGGTERCTVELANLLSVNENRNISIISINASNTTIKYEVSPRVKITKFNNEKISNAVERRIKTFRRLKYEIENNKYDIIVIVDTYKSLCFIPLLPILKQKNIKLISWEHFNYYSGEKYSSRWWGRKVAAKISDAVVVLCKNDYKVWEQNGCDSEKLVAIYNFSHFDLVEPDFNPNNKIVLAIGRLEKQKGFDYLLNIWKEIENDSELSDWTLQIIGSGSLEKELYLQEKELKLKRVEWYPFTQQIENFYRHSSIYVMSSRIEGFPLVLLEAKAFGLPIVSFDIETGPNEIVMPEINGYLVEPFDIKKFVERLSSLMKNPDLLQKFTSRSQDNMNAFSKKEIVNQWIELFDTVLKIG